MELVFRYGYYERILCQFFATKNLHWLNLLNILMITTNSLYSALRFTSRTILIFFRLFHVEKV